MISSDCEDKCTIECSLSEASWRKVFKERMQKLLQEEQRVQELPSSNFSAGVWEGLKMAIRIMEGQEE